MKPFSLNIRGSLRQFTRPTVMGILNVTPDSFYDKSRALSDADIAARAAQLAAKGADFIDVGAYSTRPGCAEVSTEEEMDRLAYALPIVRQAAPNVILSVDTFRRVVARQAIELWGADMINDVTGGYSDPSMFELAADLHVPYVLTHMRGTPQNMQEYTDYEDVTRDVLSELGDRFQQLCLLGAADVIIDPGFGFSKTLEQNYRLLDQMQMLELFHRPLLVGLSRKSMATKLLNITPDEALNATTALNTIALQRGASILRVHDVAPARQAIEIFEKCKQPNPSVHSTL